MALVDTNILLRWLLGDHAELSAKAEKLIAAAKRGQLLVTDVVLGEVVYILRSTGRDRQQMAQALSLITRTEAFSFDNENVVQRMIDAIAATNLDFADCYLAARATVQSYDLQTFDGPLRKHFLSSMQ